MQCNNGMRVHYITTWRNCTELLLCKFHVFHMEWIYANIQIQMKKWQWLNFASVPTRTAARRTSWTSALNYKHVFYAMLQKYPLITSLSSSFFIAIVKMMILVALQRYVCSGWIQTTIHIAAMKYSCILLFGLVSLFSQVFVLWILNLEKVPKQIWKSRFSIDDIQIDEKDPTTPPVFAFVTLELLDALEEFLCALLVMMYDDDVDRLTDWLTLLSADFTFLDGWIQ